MTKVRNVPSCVPLQTIEIPITNATNLNALAFTLLDLSLYDHGYLNTAVCKSSISYINGAQGERDHSRGGWVATLV
jgi:hypothetical protein